MVQHDMMMLDHGMRGTDGNLNPEQRREANERRDHIGFGWDPHWHQPTDVFSTFTDKDFRLGLNAQTTLAAIAQLAGVTITGTALKRRR